MNKYKQRKDRHNIEKGALVKPTLSKPTDEEPKDRKEGSQTYQSEFINTVSQALDCGIIPLARIVLSWL